MRDYVQRSLLEAGPWNLDGSEDMNNWSNAVFIRHATPRGLAIEMNLPPYWYTSIYRAPNCNIPYWLSGRLPENYKRTKYFPDADPFDDVVCLD